MARCYWRSQQPFKLEQPHAWRLLSGRGFFSLFRKECFSSFQTLLVLLLTSSKVPFSQNKIMMLPLLHNSLAPATSSLHNTQLGHDDDGLSFPPFLMKIDDDEATEGRRLLSMVRGVSSRLVVGNVLSLLYTPHCSYYCLFSQSTASVSLGSFRLTSVSTLEVGLCLTWWCEMLGIEQKFQTLWP